MSLISFNSRETSTLAPQWQFQLFCRDIPRRPLQHDSDPQHRSFSSPETQWGDASPMGKYPLPGENILFPWIEYFFPGWIYFLPGHSWWLAERVLHPGAPTIQSGNYISPPELIPPSTWGMPQNNRVCTMFEHAEAITHELNAHDEHAVDNGLDLSALAEAARLWKSKLLNIKFREWMLH